MGQRVAHDFVSSNEESLRHEARWAMFYRRVWGEGVVAYTMNDADYQRRGIDTVCIVGAKAITIDEKIRWTDYGDFLVEIWSDRASRKLGWTIAPEKTCDFVAWAVAPKKACRLIRYPALRTRAKAHLREWCREDSRFPRVARNETGGRIWETWNVAVPFAEIDDLVVAQEEW